MSKTIRRRRSGGKEEHESDNTPRRTRKREPNTWDIGDQNSFDLTHDLDDFFRELDDESFDPFAEDPSLDEFWDDSLGGIRH